MARGGSNWRNRGYAFESETDRLTGLLKTCFVVEPQKPHIAQTLFNEKHSKHRVIGKFSHISRQEF